MVDDSWATAERTALVVRPIRTLAMRWMPPVAAGAVPLLLALLWLTAASGWWVLVCIVALVLGATLLIAYAAFRTARVVVSEAGIRVAGMLGRTRIAADEIASTLVADVHRTDGPGTSPVLLVVGHDRRPLLRLDGVFWAREDMMALAAAVDAPETGSEAPITRGDLHRILPSAARWFERAPRPLGLRLPD